MSGIWSPLESGRVYFFNFYVLRWFVLNRFEIIFLLTLPILIGTIQFLLPRCSNIFNEFSLYCFTFVCFSFQVFRHLCCQIWRKQYLSKLIKVFKINVDWYWSSLTSLKCRLKKNLFQRRNKRSSRAAPRPKHFHIISFLPITSTNLENLS